MTISSVPIIIGRIKAAEIGSPIAVFAEGENKLNAVFGQTVDTAARIKNSDPLLVGSFDKTMNIKQIRCKLIKITGEK